MLLGCLAAVADDQLTQASILYGSLVQHRTILARTIRTRLRRHIRELSEQNLLLLGCLGALSEVVTECLDLALISVILQAHHIACISLYLFSLSLIKIRGPCLV